MTNLPAIALSSRSPSRLGCSPLPSSGPKTITLPTPRQGTGPPYHCHQPHPHRELSAHKPELTWKQRKSKMSQRGANCFFIRYSWEAAEPSQLRLRPALGQPHAGLVWATTALVCLQYWSRLCSSLPNFCLLCVPGTTSLFSGGSEKLAAELRSKAGSLRSD